MEKPIKILFKFLGWALILAFGYCVFFIGFLLYDVFVAEGLFLSLVQDSPIGLIIMLFGAPLIILLFSVYHAHRNN